MVGACSSKTVRCSDARSFLLTTLHAVAATPTIITERTRAHLGLQPLGGGQRLEGVTATGAGAAPRVMLNDCRLGGEAGCVVNMDALVMGNDGVLPPGVDGCVCAVYVYVCVCLCRKTDEYESLIQTPSPSPPSHTLQTTTIRLLGVKWMAYFGIVDIDFAAMTLSVFPCE